MESLSKTIGSVLGLAAFAVACVGGLLARADAATILFQGIVAMVIGMLIGRILGAIGAQGMREHVDRHIANNPPPAEPQELLDLREARGMDPPGAEQRRGGGAAQRAQAA